MFLLHLVKRDKPGSADIRYLFVLTKLSRDFGICLGVNGNIVRPALEHTAIRSFYDQREGRKQEEWGNLGLVQVLHRAFSLPVAS
jgi:hypothetical protein